MLAEDFKPPRRARHLPHNWVEQMGKKRESEKRHQDGISTPDRELRKRKGSHMLVTDGEIN